MKVQFKVLGMLLAAVLMLTGIRAEAAPAARTDWNKNVITVTGTGLPPAGNVGAAARVRARRAAVADAYRMLAEYVQGVQVDAETTVDDLTLGSDVIKTKVSAVVKGARIIDEKFISDGAYEVTMVMPLFGAGSLATAVIEQPPANEQPKPFVEPQAIPQVTTTTTVTVTVGTGNYTGLIVDCRGLKVKPVMSPVIKTTSNIKIYGHENLDYKKVIADGMASYAEDMSQAERAGSNPLIIKALDMADFNADPVVSEEDAARILSENKVSGFLSKTAVVFLY